MRENPDSAIDTGQYGPNHGPEEGPTLHDIAGDDDYQDHFVLCDIFDHGVCDCREGDHE